LKNLEAQENDIRTVVMQMMKPGEVQTYPIDLLAMAVMNRAVSNIYAFTTLIRQKNFGIAAAVLRLHLDSLLRLSACWLQEKPHELAMLILRGERLDKQKDQYNRLMSDKYLAEQLSEKHPWVLKVYQETSGYVHLSRKHMLLANEVEGKNKLISKISRFDDVSKAQKEEAINCMMEITRLQIGYLQSWNYQKRNPEAVAKVQRLDLVKRMSLKTDFENSEHIIAFFEEKLPEFKNRFEAIKQLVGQTANDENFNNAYQHFVKIFDAVPLMATKLNPDLAITRMRPNYNGEIFSSQSEISYHSDPKKATAGRFNTPGEAIFYGALPIRDNKLDFSLQGCLESCKALIDKTNPVMLQDVTVGLWRLRETLPVVNLCFDEKHLLTNIDLKIATAHYLKMLKKNYSKAGYQFIHEFLSFFSALSRSENADESIYFVTTALFAAIRYYYTEELGVPFAGIIYPSSATEGIGLNTALVPIAVDQVMFLDKVGMYRFELNKTSDSYKAYPCADLVDVKNGQFIISGYFKP